MKKILVLSFLVIMILSATCLAADFADMPDNWATSALNAAVDNGLMSGSDGYIYPDNPMTRAEMAAIIVRATGAETEADISSFSDVNTGDWFYSDMAKAVQMKAFNGSDGMLNPNNNITRQEAFVVLARVFGLDRQPDKTYSELAAFSDGDQVADWAKDGVNMLIKYGYVGGNDGRINPLDNITRAEFAVVMDRLVKYYIDEPGDYTPETDGNIMIRSGGVNINNLTTDKMICVGDLADDETVTLNNCDMTGLVIVRSGTLSVGGKYTDLRALTSSAVLDITGLSKEVVDSVQIFVDGGTLYIDYSKYGSN